METFLVEHYWPGVTAEEFRAAAARVRAAAAQLTAPDAAVHFVSSTLVPADENAFCVFSADSAALVEEAYRRANVPFERIRAALQLGGEPSSSTG